MTVERPSRLTSILASAALVVLWAWIRVVAFDTMVFPLTYALPLLIGVWTRDKVATWGMAAAFCVLHIIKLYWVLPDHTLTSVEAQANLVATVANILVAAAAVHAIIVLRSRLEHALADVRAQAEELRIQSEELAQQNEELAEQTEELSRQTEELSQQGEELASQNEELQLQAEDISGLNMTLDRRERLLETLLETARVSTSEHTALKHIAVAALDLFGDLICAAAVYEDTDDGPRLHAHAATSPLSAERLAASPPEASRDSFAALVIGQARTAALDDLSTRPDLTVSSVLCDDEISSALGAPIRINGASAGAIVVYAATTHPWTAEQFQLAEWLADLSARALETLRLQAALRAEDDRKSEFLATLSHELRNPLAPMRVALPLISRGGDAGASAMLIMERQFRQLVRLVDDLLDATRLSKNKIQVRRVRTDLLEVVTHATDATRSELEAAGQDLQMDLPASPVWVNADPERIAQVVTNLLNNAGRYTPAGGRIHITVAATADSATLTVADTGIGIAPGDLARVFDMFTQVGGPGSGGLGIGLAIVRGIVELHDGAVTALSDGHGRGSSFVVRLPREVMPEPAVVASTAPHRTAPRRVLVVDDNADAAEMIQALLSLHGHTVTVAHDAEAALELALQAAFDVALLDIGLPGMDGYQLARRLRGHDRTRHLRLVAVTGWGQDADKVLALDAGFDAHLTKPAEPDVVLSIL